MKLNAKPLERRLQLAGILIILSLLVEVFSLLWNRPLAFLAYIAAGGFLLSAGVLVYLYSLVTFNTSEPSTPDQTRP
ncbi:MAG TPA: hypothetical protein VOA64_13520 [Candidatus Dormibacteraeota bacterium]|nr:hypothetical protein [Candidatus Dormibacteraeota bacterium]